jgi:hypothetical protein
MAQGRSAPFLQTVVLAVAVGLLGSQASRGAEGEDELRARIEANGREIAALREQVHRQATPPAPAPSVNLGPDAVREIVAGYLQENPGAGLPLGVQTGYFPNAGFVIRSAPDPPYARWQDESRIPFELRTRVRINVAYVFYKVTDHTNHLTGQVVPSLSPDFSQLMVKRAQLIEDGTAFDPDLRFRLSFHGDTRGLPANVSGNPFFPPGNAFPTGGAFVVDNTVRMNEAWLAYDWHGRERPAGPDRDGRDGATYRPTFTLTVGKRKAFFGLEEYLGNPYEQFVELSMADLFFDADDDNLSMEAGFQVKALEDRFFLEAVVTDGSVSLTPSLLLDDLPGFITGFWYDFGGSWNEAKKAWDLFGTGIPDLEFSPRPVVRAGGSLNLVPLDRRSLYGDAEQSRYFVVPGGPGGTRLINVLTGDVAVPAVGPPSAHAVDAFDAFSFNAFLAAKYRGFSLLSEGWLRDLTHFQSLPAGQNLILYQDRLGPGGAAANALFPAHASLIDYGAVLQAGYFLIPKKLEVAARWSWVRGNSGNINGNGTFTTVSVPGVAGPVHVVGGAFHQFHQANEYTIGLNYYFRGQQLKWQTDFSVYRGGNPANPGVTYPGFIGGVDGYMIRTQLSLFF